MEHRGFLGYLYLDADLILELVVVVAGTVDGQLELFVLGLRLVELAVVEQRAKPVAGPQINPAYIQQTRRRVDHILKLLFAVQEYA